MEAVSATILVYCLPLNIEGYIQVPQEQLFQENPAVPYNSSTDPLIRNLKSVSG